MDTLSLLSNIVSVGDVAGRALGLVYDVLNHWISAPREVLQLGDSVRASRGLMDQLHHAMRSGQLLPLGHAPDGLITDLIAVEDILRQLESILVTVRGQSGLPGAGFTKASQPSVKARWAINRALVLGLQSSLSDCRNRMMTRLQILNVVVATKIEASLNQQHLTTQSIGNTLAQDIQQGRDVVLSQLRNTSSELSTGVARIEEQLSQYGQTMISRASHASGLEVALTERISQTDRFIEERFERLAAEQDFFLQIRDAQSEQRFRHLERIFRATVAPAVVTQAIDECATSNFSITADVDENTTYQQPDLNPTNKIQTTCSVSCRCRCHRKGARSFYCALQGFRCTIGSVLFRFHGTFGSPCDTEICRSHHFRRATITYSFPPWLFHAGLSASFSAYSGSPEMNIRIIRRVATRTNILDHALRRDVQSLKNDLARRNGSIYDVTRSGVSALQLVFSLRTGNGQVQQSENQFLQLVQVFVAEGADPFQEDDFGRSPCEGIIQYLYANSTISLPFRSRVESVLPMGRIIDHCGFTNLHKAVLGITRVTISPQYLRSKVDNGEIDAVDNLGQTALGYACARGDISVVEALLGAGAATDVHAYVAVRTPLMNACRYGNLKMVRMLLDAGADVHAKDARKITALGFACIGFTPNTRVAVSDTDTQRNGRLRVQIVSDLVALGADPFAVDDYGCSMLDIAVTTDGAVSVVAFLLDMGLNPDQQDNDGTTALGNAIFYNAHQSAVLLLRHGTDLSIVDYSGDGILHYMARYGKMEIMDVFVKMQVAGIDSRCKNHDGKTPLQVFNNREDSADARLRDKFLELLRVCSRVQRRGITGEQEDSEGENEQFFDASEEWD